LKAPGFINPCSLKCGFLVSKFAFIKRNLCRYVAGTSLPLVQWIGSHGQTIAHVPCVDDTRGWRTPSTLQIGEPSEIAQALGVTVVADFRPRDMACGGGGAPLMPAAEAVLFRHLLRGGDGGGFMLQNIGGIGSLTALSASGDVLMSFDTGPGNMVMDLIVQAAAFDDEYDDQDEYEDEDKWDQDGYEDEDEWAQVVRDRRRDRRREALPRRDGTQHDVDGELAAAGRVIQPALEWAQRHPFFASPPPRSGGHEHFGAAFVEEITARCEAGARLDAGYLHADGTWRLIHGSAAASGGGGNRPATTSDLVRTALELTATTIVASIRGHVLLERPTISSEASRDASLVLAAAAAAAAGGGVVEPPHQTAAQRTAARLVAAAAAAAGGGGLVKPPH
jgi:1,6-anhydro-N-acetylmuramate kinase